MLITARLGDKLAMRGRARLIWAAQTAQACRDLGLPTMLAGSVRDMPLKYDGPDGLAGTRRFVSTFYNVAADYEIKGLYGPPQTKDGKQEEAWADGRYELEAELSRYVLQEAGLVHTRDPRLAKLCAKRRVRFIYEDHEEDYHVALTSPDEAGLLSDQCLAVVAITEHVKTRLMLLGVPGEKIIVADSGVNRRAFLQNPERNMRWRRFLLQAEHQKVAVYCGGMQEERGIQHILDAAKDLPHVMFVLTGGNQRDSTYWQAQSQLHQLNNIKVFGYVPQDVAIELQRAADVVIMTRLPGQRTQITSPLKFFEYLATGRPIVAPRISALSKPEFEHLNVAWYDPSTPNHLSKCLEDVFRENVFSDVPEPSHVDVAKKYTWDERQLRILRFCGLQLPHQGD